MREQKLFSMSGAVFVIRLELVVKIKLFIQNVLPRPTIPRW